MERKERVRGRRRYLRTAGATVASIALAGCTDGSPDNASDPSGDGNETGDGSSTTDEDDAESIHADYETTEVTVSTTAGERLGSVTAAIADTRDMRRLGLSDTEHLPEDRGMLFIFGGVADRTFVMREMDFGIDIVYADADGTITGIHHAPAPEPDEDGSDQRYPGRGQYVLEVSLDWTTDRGVETGDVLDWGS